MSLEMEQINYIEALFDEFDRKYDTEYELQDLHMQYIMENCHGDRVICNGDMLIEAQEDGYLYEDFREEYISKRILEEK